MLCSQRVNEGTDVWSYAVVLWELLTSEEPFQKMTFFQIATQVVDRNVRLVLPSSTPAAMAQLVRDCWEKESEDRPNFAEILDRVKEMKKDKFSRIFRRHV